MRIFPNYNFDNKSIKCITYFCDLGFIIDSTTLCFMAMLI